MSKQTEVAEAVEIDRMFQSLCVDLSDRVAQAEEEQIKRVLTVLGLPVDPAALVDRLQIDHPAIGRKLLIVDGKPLAWIITEAPAPDWNKSDAVVDYRFTVRAEAYRVAV